jgi:hypothetical protein
MPHRGEARSHFHELEMFEAAGRMPGASLPRGAPIGFEWVKFLHGLDNMSVAWSDLVYGVTEPSLMGEFLKSRPICHFD